MGPHLSLVRRVSLRDRRDLGFPLDALSSPPFLFGAALERCRTERDAPARLQATFLLLRNGTFQTRGVVKCAKHHDDDVLKKSLGCSTVL